ncbi:MAG: hypothetical protein CMC14_11270 [Flavobacteriaceae bacterium]|nr:hypothetical protein [Flavobacteriaceae bacterium]
MKSAFLFFFGAILSFNTLSQVYPPEPEGQDPFYLLENIPKAPEAASLGQYGDIANNPYTGKANITIPLYSINFDGLQIPIQLNYDTGGVRVAQEAGWVGLNWSLSTNFGISRKIMGSDDLISQVIGVADGRTTPVGFIYNNYNLGVGPYGNPEMSDNNIRDIHYSFTANPSGGRNYRIDTQPDIFDVSLFGKTYKFRLEKKQTGSNIVQCYAFNNRNVKITYNVTSSQQAFTIIDENGFEYYFKTKDYSTSWASPEPDSNTFDLLSEMMNDDPNRADETTITNWLLDKIKSPYGQELIFTYQSGTHLSVPGFSSFEIQQEHTYGDEYRVIGGIPKHSRSVTVISSNYLSKIEGDFGKVQFNLEDRDDLMTGEAIERYLIQEGQVSSYPFSWITSQGQIRQCHGNPSCTNSITATPKRLGSITIKDFNNTTIEDIDFQYTYFDNDKFSNQDKEFYLRLKLDKLVIGEKEYSFSYIQPNDLPNKISFAVDFWGFYNGKLTNTSLIPKVGRFTHDQLSIPPTQSISESFMEYSGANRGSDFNFGKIGNLETVFYPTGGKSEIIYEPHLVVLDPPNPYIVTEEHSNGRIFKTNLTNEKEYKFTYQYLKRAKDASYSFYDHRFVSGGTTGNGTMIWPEIGFEVTAPSTLEVNGHLTLWYYGCNMPYYESEPKYYIQDPSTNQNLNTIFYFNEWLMPEGCPNPTNQFTETNSIKSFILAPGYYKITHHQPETIVINGQYITPPAITVNNGTLPQNPAYTLYDTVSNNVLTPETFEIGGSRVLSISNYSNNGSFISKKQYNYDYFNATEPTLASSGKLMDDLVYFSKAYGYHSYNPRQYNSSRFQFTSTPSITGNPSAEGSYIGYSNTTELVLDQNDNVLASNERTFHNQPNEYFVDSVNTWYGYTCYGSSHYLNTNVTANNIIVLGMDPLNSYSYINGKVLSESQFDIEGNEISKSNYLYQTVNLNNDTTYYSTFMGLPTQNALLPPQCRPEVYGPYLADHSSYDPYQMPSYYGKNAMLMAKETFVNVDNGELISKEQFNYDLTTLHLLNKNTEVFENDFLKQEYFYPYSSEVYNNSQMSNLRTNNQLSTLIKTRNKRNSVNLSERLLEFDNYNGNSMISKISIKKGGQTNFTEKAVYEEYDDDGRLLQSRKSNGIPISYIWGYNGQQVVAKVVNATYSQIEALSSFGQNFTINNGLSSTQEDALRALSNVIVNTYQYNPLIGVSQMRNERNDISKYEYDTENRLKYILDKNDFIVNEFQYNMNSEYNPLKTPIVNDTSYVVTNSQLLSNTTYLSKNRNYDDNGNLNLTAGIRLETVPSYIGNTTLNYTIIAQGGSGNYQYKWRVKGNEYNPVSSSDNWAYSLDCSTINEPVLYVYCEVIDTQTGKIFTANIKHGVNCY